MTKNIVEKTIAENVVKMLNSLNIQCYIWHLATTGSVYIRFDDVRMGSIRIGDHPGREKLKYKWNIRLDKVKEGWRKDDTWRYYVRHNNWKNIIPFIQKRAEEVKQWKEAKYTYTKPAFKL